MSAFEDVEVRGRTDERGTNRHRSAIVALILLIGAAGVRAWWPRGGPAYPGTSLASAASPGALVVHLALPLPGLTVALPTATASFGDRAIRMDTHQATGDWHTPQPLGFPTIGHIFGPAVHSGAELDFVGDASSVTATVAPMGRQGQSVAIVLHGGVGRLPHRAGTYNLFVTAYWPQGQAEFAVFIMVKGT